MSDKLIKWKPGFIVLRINGHISYRTIKEAKKTLPASYQAAFIANTAICKMIATVINEDK